MTCFITLSQQTHLSLKLGFLIDHLVLEVIFLLLCHRCVSSVKMIKDHVGELQTLLVVPTLVLCLDELVEKPDCFQR